MTELALQRVQRDSLPARLDREPVPELVRSDATAQHKPGASQRDKGERRIVLTQEHALARVAEANRKRRKLTAGQVREIRLSEASHADEARKLGLAPETIRKIRQGHTYGALRPDERAAQAARESSLLFDPRAEAEFQTWHALVVGGSFPVLGRSDLVDTFDALDALDAVHECEHGRLAGDRTPACGCWPQEAREVVVLPVRLDDYPKEMAA